MLSTASLYSDNLFVSDEIKNYSNRFDLITLWDVLEHILNPRYYLIDIVSALRSNGKLLIQTPNFGLLAEKFGSAFAHYLVIEHINLFSRRGVIALIESAGLRLLHAGSFGANINSELCHSSVKLALDSLAKELDFGATQVLLFEKI